MRVVKVLVQEVHDRVLESTTLCSVKRLRKAVIAHENFFFSFPSPWLSLRPPLL